MTGPECREAIIRCIEGAKLRKPRKRKLPKNVQAFLTGGLWCVFHCTTRDCDRTYEAVEAQPTHMFG